MWSHWKQRFMKAGARKIDFSTSRVGGSKSGKEVTRAKCLLFFEGDKPDKAEILRSQFGLEYIVNEILCTERMEVRMLQEENFGHQVKDSDNGCYYGTKEGYPILDLTPSD